MAKSRKHVPVPQPTAEASSGATPRVRETPKTDKPAPMLRLESTITCPECGAATHAHMPTDACQFFWDCPACDAVLKPKPGDCCVFCSWGDVPCPPVQANRDCCG